MSLELEIALAKPPDYRDQRQDHSTPENCFIKGQRRRLLFFKCLVDLLLPHAE